MAENNRLHSVNSSRVLRAIRQNPGISRIKVAELLDLDRSTVTKILQVILERGLVYTAGKNTAQRGVGRRQVNLEISPDIGVVLGIEMQRTYYRAVLLDLAGAELQYFEGEHILTHETMDHALAAIIDAGRAAASAREQRLIGIGVGVPGEIDPYSGKICSSLPLALTESYPLRDKLAKLCPEPVFIENDANCCCWSELAFRPGPANRNSLAVLGEFRKSMTPDRAKVLSVGLGFVIRSRVLHGDHFNAGEFRSIYATGDDHQFHATSKDFSPLPENKPLLRKVYSELCENLALLANCIGLNKIVFAGDFLSSPENLEKTMSDAVMNNHKHRFTNTVAIEFSPYGNSAVCMGAAGMFIEKLFTVPDVTDHFRETVGFDLFERIAKGRI